MKLSWFCHTISGQLFVISLVPGLFFGGKPDETCCHSVVASNWLKTRVNQLYYNLNTDRDYLEFGSSTSEEVGRAMY